MKKIISLISIVLFLPGCDTNDDISIKTSMIIGDLSTENLFFINIEPDITLGNFQTKDSSYIDVDNNAVNDYMIKTNNIWIQGGLILAYFEVNIYSLSNDAYILVDSTNNPEVLVLNDTITINDKWDSGNFVLVKKMNSLVPPFSSYTTTGNWDNIKESYIGIKSEKDLLGWIKISLTQYGARIDEYATQMIL